MYDPDYSGDMSYYVNQLLRHGITKEYFDITKYVGLTARELQSLVDRAIAYKRLHPEEYK